MTAAQIIAVVSGKGGVGKTMLSVAIASELSRGCKTLLLDLDFFNRGLTGLLASLKSTRQNKAIAAPQFLKQGADAEWSIAEVQTNLLMVYYGDLDKSESDLLDTANVTALTKDLRAYIDYLVTQSECEFVVLDCHGGPDNISFAACAVASRAILVSEPDRITLHGTLNFLRILRQEVGAAPIDIRLVFNKVVTGFSSIFLINFYNRYLRDEFDKKELLAIFPLEIYLTKAFERIPILTSAYPQSQLAIKTRLVLHELFYGKSGVRLPRLVAVMTAFERFQAKYYMGRWPRLLDLDFSLKLIATYALLAFGVPNVINFALDYFEKQRYESTYYRNMAIAVLGISVYWVLAVTSLQWSKELDIFFTYNCRTRRFTKAFGAWAVLAVLWGLPAAFGGLLTKAVFKQSSPWPFAALIFGAVPVLLALSKYGTRAIRNIRIEKAFFEGLFRIAFLVITIGAATYTVFAAKL